MVEKEDGTLIMDLSEVIGDKAIVNMIDITTGKDINTKEKPIVERKDNEDE